MGAASCRVVPALVPVGDKEVLLTIIEEFGPGENCGVPIHVRIAGPDGLTTEGKYPEVWQEMLELLGVGKPADGDREKAAISTRHSAGVSLSHLASTFAGKVAFRFRPDPPPHWTIEKDRNGCIG